MKVIKTNIKAETVEINPREALRNTFQDNRRTYNDNIRKYTKQYDLDTGEMSYREIRQSIVRLRWQSKTVMRTLITAVIKETVGAGRSCVP